MIGWVSSLVGLVRPRPPLDARVLTIMGLDPDRPWYVTDLAGAVRADAIETAGVLASLLDRGLIDYRLVTAWGAPGGGSPGPYRWVYRRVYVLPPRPITPGGEDLA